MFTPDLIFTAVLLIVLFLVYNLRKLTMSGTIVAGMVAVCIFKGSGFLGILMLAVFFVLATVATSVGKSFKGKTHQERRNAAQVVANGGMAALIGLVMWINHAPGYPLIFFLAASLSSATADTLSSELGTVYGRRFFNIITFRRDERGRDGVISLEGTLAGLFGSAIIGVIYLLLIGGSGGFWLIIIAGTAGNLFDSVLGATLERKGIIQNNTVNFLNTAFAVLIAWLFTI
ncbi:hypothetical protein BC343_01445 [Mucilaginibacter pedocola]|uniref:TIGR00297 family protein n=2 Tax=Mucilaginibacter pedocola TaxID=1792845 RepID=A0A1S9PLC5_9SPHI|nr:hypothetical protein BC343_01445 [Mucilaginibacter pedocola]